MRQARPLEADADTGADQMLAQITEGHITQIDTIAPGEPARADVRKSRRVVEKMIFDERAEPRRPIVVCARDDLPRQIPVAKAFGVDCTKNGEVSELEPVGLGISSSNASSCIWLESLVSRCESQYEVHHEGARVTPCAHVGLVQNVTNWVPQGEVPAEIETVVKEISLNGGTNYARAKDVTEFDAAENADVMFLVQIETESKRPLTGKILSLKF